MAELSEPLVALGRVWVIVGVRYGGGIGGWVGRAADVVGGAFVVRQRYRLTHPTFAYYRGGYDGGAAWLLITDDHLRFFCGRDGRVSLCDRSMPASRNGYGVLKVGEAEEALRRLLTVFPQAVSSMALGGHREALCGRVGCGIGNGG